MYVAIHFPLTKWASLGLTEKWKSINRGPEGFSDCVVLVKKIPVLINPIYADSLLVSKTDLITDIVPGHQTSSLCVLSGWWQEWRWNKHSSHLSCLSNKTYKLHFHELRYQYSNYSTPFEKKKKVYFQQLIFLLSSENGFLFFGDIQLPSLISYLSLHQELQPRPSQGHPFQCSQNQVQRWTWPMTNQAEPESSSSKTTSGTCVFAYSPL